jgi:hypothetical protein
MAVSFIGGGNRNNRRKPQICRKSLTKVFAWKTTEQDKKKLDAFKK